MDVKYSRENWAILGWSQLKFLVLENSYLSVAQAGYRDNGLSEVFCNNLQ